MATFSQHPETKGTVAVSTARLDWLPSIVIGAFMAITAVAGFFLAIFFKEELSFTGQQIGFLFAVQASTGVLAAFPAGLGNDRVTSRTIIALGLVAQACGFVLLGTQRTFASLLLVYFGWSLANNLCKLSLDVLLLKTDSGEKTATRVALYGAWRLGGLAVGTVITGYLLNLSSFKDNLLIAAVLCLILAALSLGLAPTPARKVKLSEYWTDLSEPKVIFFAVWLFLFTSHWGAEGTSYGLFLRQDLHLSMTEMGWYMGGEYLIFLVAMLLLAKRVFAPGSLRRYGLMALLLSGLGSIGTALPSLPWSVGFRLVHGAGDGIMLLIQFLGISRLFRLERLGGNAGFISTMTMLGFVAGALVYGPMGEAWGYGVALQWCGVVSLLLIIPLMVGKRSQFVS